MLAICICSATMAGILSLFAMVANGVLLYVMYKDPLNCFRKPITVLLAALAVNDFLTGSVISTLHILNEISCETRTEGLTVKGTFETIIGLFAINNGTLLVMGLSGERLIAVALPFYYRATASGRKTFTCVVCIVAYSFLFCLLQLSSIPMGIYYTLQLHFNITFPLVAALIFNFALLRLLRKHRRRTRSMSSDASGDGYFAENDSRYDMDKQFAFTAILIVLFLVLSHTPYYLMTLIEVHCSHCVQGDWFISCRRISLPFLFINSACNPFTYTFRIRQCRRSFKVLFFKWQETVDVSPRTSQIVNPRAARKEIVLRKISRMCPKTGEFVEEFREANVPDYFDLGIDNPVREDLGAELDVWDRETEETKEPEDNEETIRDESVGVGICNHAQESLDEEPVYDTKL